MCDWASTRLETWNPRTCSREMGDPARHYPGWNAAAVGGGVAAMDLNRAAIMIAVLHVSLGLSSCVVGKTYEKEDPSN